MRKAGYSLPRTSGKTRMSRGYQGMDMRHGVAVFAAGLLTASVAIAQELPSSLQVVGTVKPTNAAPVTVLGAQVLVIDKGTGTALGSGAVLDAQGTFAIELFRTADFNGRVVRLTLRHAGATYDLQDGGIPAEFPYAGSFPFPARVTKTVTVSLAGSALPATQAAHKLDINGNGVFDEEDVEAIRNGLATGGAKDVRFDVNGDGVFNSLDVVEAKRALARERTR